MDGFISSWLACQGTTMSTYFANRALILLPRFSTIWCAGMSITTTARQTGLVTRTIVTGRHSCDRFCSMCVPALLLCSSAVPSFWRLVLYARDKLLIYCSLPQIKTELPYFDRHAGRDHIFPCELLLPSYHAFTPWSPCRVAIE